MSIDEHIGGPSREDRRLIYARAGMSNAAIEHAEQMVFSAPGREVGRAALDNVVSLFVSQKNAQSRITESHTCEQIYAYELELDPDVVGYYTQVTCRQVERTTGQGRRHISSAHLDFLVFRTDSVKLVECKPLHRIVKSAERHGNDWEYREGCWHHVPYETFAAQHELTFEVWIPPVYSGVYQQTLEACYAVVRHTECAPTSKLVDEVLCVLAKRPRTLLELYDDVPGFDARTALWMMGRRLLYGTWEVTPLSMPERFIVSLDREQTVLLQQSMRYQRDALYEQSELLDPLLRASTTDLSWARSRYARLKTMWRGEVAWTVRMRQLDKCVRQAIVEGKPPLEACLTHYGDSGNYLSRLSVEQEECMRVAIARHWNTGKFVTPQDLYIALERECEKQHVICPSRTAFYKRLKRENPARRALATGGLRGYQAIRPATDPRKRSLTPLGYGHTLHIDSSKLDNRNAPDLLKHMPALCATFYIGVDGQSGDTMAHAIIFGSARTDGIAILLREYVRRHGRLPDIIHIDRGPENKSLWLRRFAEGYITLRWSPTAGSPWNGIAENIIKQVNHNVAHKLIGSTAPDQKGRKVDGRFKSYRNAKTAFDVTTQQCRTYIYDILPNTPDGDNLTPIEKKEAALALYGEMGTPCALDESFLIRTSIKVDIKKNIDPKRGVRTEEGFFTSDELINVLRVADAEELRSDCEDPTILRVLIAGRWIKAFHSKVQTRALATPEEKLFDLLYAPIKRASARERKAQNARGTFDRIQFANFATTSAADQASDQAPGGVAAATENVAEGGDTASNDTDDRRALWKVLTPYNAKGA